MKSSTMILSVNYVNSFYSHLVKNLIWLLPLLRYHSAVGTGVWRKCFLVYCCSVCYLTRLDKNSKWWQGWWAGNVHSKHRFFLHFFLKTLSLSPSSIAFPIILCFFPGLKNILNFTFITTQVPPSIFYKKAPLISVTEASIHSCLFLLVMHFDISALSFTQIESTFKFHWLTNLCSSLQVSCFQKIKHLLISSFQLVHIPF